MTKNEAEDKLEQRKKIVENWLSDKYNLILIGIIIIALAIRIYYNFLTRGQALWWDEAEYGASGKYIAGIIPEYELSQQRPFLFLGLIALFVKLGIGEIGTKFFLSAIPSIAIIPLFYLLGKEMYNKNIGLIAAFLASVSWTFLFWSQRLQPDFISIGFQVLAIYFMWKYWKNPKTLLIVLAAAFASLGFQFKVSGMLVPIIFLTFMLIRERISIFIKKDYWIFIIVFLLVLIPQFVYSQVVFGSPTYFITGSGYMGAVTASNPIGWYNIKFYYLLTENIFFILFIIGLIISLKFLLYFDIMLKDKNKMLDPNLFAILVFLIVSCFYIFYIKGTEDRWVFLWMPFIFFFIGNALLFIYDKLNLHNIKYFAVILVVTIVIIGGYYQVKHADSLIKIKKDSYMPVKLGGEWIKQNSEKEDIVLSISLTQTAYYSERKVISYSVLKFNNKNEFDKWLENNNPKYIQVSIFEPHPAWINDWINENKERIEPVQAYTDNMNRPLLIIYKIHRINKEENISMQL